MQTTERELQQAVAHHQAGRLPEAEEGYRAVLQAEAEHAIANHNLGALHVEMGKPDDALPYFEAALATDPATGQYWLSYVDALLLSGKKQAASEILGFAEQHGLNGSEVDLMKRRLSMSDEVAESGTSDTNISSLLLQDKLEVIDLAFSRFDLHSFADLGGVWRVEGGYTFHALDRHGVGKAVLVDTHPTDIVLRRAQQYPSLEVLAGNFGDESIARKVGSVDAIFLFDVLLHQVAPDWPQVLEMYAPQTRCFIIYNQQWIGPGRNVRLLELGEEGYFGNVPHNRSEMPYVNLFQKLDEIHPAHDRPWRNVHNIWQWGITDLDLTEKMEALGFKLEYTKNCGRFGELENFENHIFVFCR